MSSYRDVPSIHACEVCGFAAHEARTCARGIAIRTCPCRRFAATCLTGDAHAELGSILDPDNDSGCFGDGKAFGSKYIELTWRGRLDAYGVAFVLRQTDV